MRIDLLAASGIGLCSSLGQSTSVCGSFGAATHAKFAEQIGDVVFYCFVRQVELDANLAVRFSRRDQREDLSLAGCEPFDALALLMGYP